VATASHRVVEVGVFALQAVSLVSFWLVEGWQVASVATAWVGPLARALGLVLVHPVFGPSMWAAFASCALVLWWMRPRGAHVRAGGRHVGLLAV
jgi:hypothetical protein